jgi:hypothetical protein
MTCICRRIVLRKKRIQLVVCFLVSLGFLMSANAADNGQKIVPILSTLLLSSKPVLAEQDLVLTLMIAQCQTSGPQGISYDTRS